MAKMLSDRGHGVLVQCRPGGDVDERAGEWGLETTGPYLGKSAFLRGVVPFSSLLDRFSPDVVCATRAEGQTACALAAPYIPLVRIRCDIRKPSSGRLWRLVDGRTRLVVFPSPFMLRRGYRGERSGPVAVVPHPVDTRRFRPAAGLRKRNPVLVSLARLSPVKGHRTLIRALALLPEEVTAVIAGPPSQQTPRELMDFAGNLGVADRLELPGRVEDPRIVLERGRIGIVTSLGSEVVSRAGMEMMSSGLPLLAAATNGLLDLVEDGKTGMLHSPGNHEQLAAQALHLLENPSLAETLGRNAGRRMVEKYGYDTVAETWEGILAAVAAGEQIDPLRVSRVKGEGG